VLVGPVTDDKDFKAIFDSERRSTHWAPQQKQKDEPKL
jgi:hypothetical protein